MNIQDYITTLEVLTRTVEVDYPSHQRISLDEGLQRVGGAFDAVRVSKSKLMFIGNGGSAAIASHMAIDYAKNGGVPSLAFNDAAALTCLGNDFGYKHIFAQQIKMHVKSMDVLIAISSSGNSPSIIEGVRAAVERGCRVVTFSGFEKDNKLRPLGVINFYVPAISYGFVEIVHLTLLHAILDLHLTK